MEVETIRWKDIRGKELLYLKITHNGNEVLINVGEKTLKSVENLNTTTHKTIPIMKNKKQK